MIAFPSLLLGPASEAGMKVPANPDEFAPDEFPHFQVFCNWQLGRPMPWPTTHWENAKIVAAIPEADIRTITVERLMAAGVV